MSARVDIGVVGLWHLGAVVAASWSGLGHRVTAVDLEGDHLPALAAGRAPVYEPGLDEALAAGLAAGRLTVSSDPGSLRGSAVVFLAYDTPVRDDDTSELDVLERALERIAPQLAIDAVLVVSAQLPVGTAARFRQGLKRVQPAAEVVYSPENLRLGEALACYLRPGHIVVGADDTGAGDRVEALFAPMNATVLRMSLASAEMTKHGINAWLATSIAFTNQLADLCAAGGADIRDVATAMRRDPRIGARAYLAPGLGFSGGTLGRDLRVLGALDARGGGDAPLFDAVWRYNRDRRLIVTRMLDRELDGLGGRRVALWGLTYKPGTSTLRRSLPLQVAADLLARGASVTAFDPRADWESTPIPEGLVRAETALAAAADADALVLLTEWPELVGADLATLRRAMRGAVLVDTKNAWADHKDRARLGFRYRGVGLGHDDSR